MCQGRPVNELIGEDIPGLLGYTSWVLCGCVTSPFTAPMDPVSMMFPGLSSVLHTKDDHAIYLKLGDLE